MHSLALSEAGEYLEQVLQACGFPAERRINEVRGDAINILLCAHLLSAEQAARLPAGSIVFNSEPLGDADERRHYSDAYPALLARMHVWDYSAKNLAAIPHDHKSLIPFLHWDGLRRSGLPRTPPLPLIFYGRLTDRRRQIVEDLSRNGVPVHVVSGYGEQRDRLMLRSWAVLNLHKGGVEHGFESIRCFYPLINGVPVISEDTEDAVADDFRDAVFFLDAQRLVDGIRGLYGNPAFFAERRRHMLAQFARKDPRPQIRSAIDRYLAR